MIFCEFRTANIDTKRYTEYVIAENFTKVDGSTDIYVAQDSVTPGLSAWPLPHDAPYKPNFDKWIQVVLEVTMNLGILVNSYIL